MTAKIATVAHVPPELVKAWLQHLRNFDVAHPGCHFQTMVDIDEVPDDVLDMLRGIEPPLQFMMKVPLKP